MIRRHLVSYLFGVWFYLLFPPLTYIYFCRLIKLILFSPFHRVSRLLLWISIFFPATLSFLLLIIRYVFFNHNMKRRHISPSPKYSIPLLLPLQTLEYLHFPHQFHSHSSDKTFGTLPSFPPTPDAQICWDSLNIFSSRLFLEELSRQMVMWSIRKKNILLESGEPSHTLNSLRKELLCALSTQVLMIHPDLGDDPFYHCIFSLPFLPQSSGDFDSGFIC